MTAEFKDRPKAKKLWSRQQDFIQAKEKLVSDLLVSAIEDAIGFWMMEASRSRSLTPETLRNYQNYIQDLVDRQILPLKDKNDQIYQIEQIADLYPVEQIADLYPEICKRLEASKDLSINEKKYRLNAVMAFTQFLEDVTNKKISKIVAPLSFGLGSTDKKPAPLILNNQEINILINEIKDVSLRDYLIVRLVMSTGRNLNKILALKMSDLDLANSVVLFQHKKGESIRFNPGGKIMATLKDYITATQTERIDDNAFITRAGKPVYRTHFQHILDQASEKAGLGFKVTMTMIQWSEVAKSLIDHQSEEKVLEEFKLQSLPKFLEAAIAGK
jgi:site-specific recombinase XerD